MTVMKIRTVFGATVMVVCMLFTSCAKDVIDLNGSIKGIVKDANDGHFIENCLIALSPGGISKTTNQSGVFEFASLVPGEYTLSFSKIGYPNTSKIVTVVTGEETNSDVLLKANSPFALSDETLNFGDLETDKSFYVANNTDTECSYTISNVPEWLTFSKTKGTIGATAQAAINAKIDRNKVDYGSFSHNVIISYSGRTTGQIFLFVKFDKVRLTVPEITVASDGENITETSFEIKGNIVATGGSQILDYGHCWSTKANPTTDDNCTRLGQRNELGVYSSSITGLMTSTTYYVRAYARNAQGIAYSEQIVVSTQDPYSDKWDGNIASSFAGGKGTKASPYIIETGGQLLLMKNYSSSYFKLANNIDLNNHNWLPFRFSGILDGCGFIIHNLRVEREEDYLGLFSSVSGNIENLTINGVLIEGKSRIGALAGELYCNGRITNCNVFLNSSSKIEGNSSVGGLVGVLNVKDSSGTSSINRCKVVSNDNDIYISGYSSIGGIAGFSGYSMELSDCSVNCNIIGDYNIGGILGAVENTYYSKIKNCEYEGDITGRKYVGGILGYSRYDVGIEACKASVNIDVEEGFAGGIWGAFYMSGDVKALACYSTGSLSSDNPSAYNIGGIGGGDSTDKYDIGGTAVFSYSTMTSPLSSFRGIGYCKSSTCAYITDYTDITTYFKELYSDYASYWNFNNEWTWSGTINGQTKQVKCPRLAWE